MRRALLLAVLLVGGVARADESRKLPFNPWDSAVEGDWLSLKVETTFEGKNANVLKKAFTQLDLVTYRVRGADSKEVKIAFETVPHVAADEERIATIFSRTETPRFDEILNVKSDVKDVKVSSEKRIVSGREFACTKIAYATLTSGGLRSENTAWFSKDVKTFGLVELVSVVPLDRDTRATLTYRVAGFGSSAKADFGKKPEDAKK